MDIQDLIQAVNAKPRGRDRWRGRCPVHGGADSFVIGLGRAGILIKCHAGCDKKQILEKLGLRFSDLKYGEGDAKPNNVEADLKPTAPNEGWRKWLQTVWDRSILLHSNESDRVSAYLRSRGLEGTESLRFNPRTLYEKGGQHYPAMIARVLDANGQLVALHKTFLDPIGPGKAKVETAKKVSRTVYEGALNGAAIRLFPHGEVLAVAEGIETALSFSKLTGIPCWSVICAGGMTRFQWPQRLKKLLIAADNDEAGWAASCDLAERALAEGLDVEVRIPDKWGQDFNDMLWSRRPKSAWL